MGVGKPSAQDYVQIIPVGLANYRQGNNSK